MPSHGRRGAGRCGPAGRECNGCPARNPNWNTMLDFTKKRASYLIVGHPNFCRPAVRAAGAWNTVSAAAPNFEKRGVVSYRFRKSKESSDRLQAGCLFPCAGVLCHGRVPCGYTQCDRCESAADLRHRLQWCPAGDPHLRDRPCTGYEPFRHPVRRGRSGLLYGLQRQPCRPEH